MEKKLTFNSQDIINEQIEKESYGYSIEQVNKFLDVVAQDYEKFHEVEKELLTKISSLKDRLDIMEKDLRKAKNSKEALKTELDEIRKGGATDYSTVLKRIASSESNVSKLEIEINSKLDKILKTLPQSEK